MRSKGRWKIEKGGFEQGGNKNLDKYLSANLKGLLRHLFCVSILLLLTQAFSGFEVKAQWNSQTSGTANNLFSIHFTDINNGWAVGGNNTILHTTNGGTTWSPVAGPGGLPTSSYLGVRFIDSNTGWVGGGSVVLRTANAGGNWDSLIDLNANNFRNNLFATSSTQAWAPIRNGLANARYFARYTDSGGGITEEAFDLLTSSVSFFDIYFTDPDNGWSVGTSGFIRRITNGTSPTPTFSSQTSGTAQTLNGIFMLDSNTGWIVGNNGTILKTIDGGANWTPQTSGTTTVLRSVHFASASIGWAVGDGGLILTTSNGGTNWATQTSGTTQTLRRVFFVNPVIGYAAGLAGTILKHGIPTAVELVAFEAQEYDDGVSLEWQTGFEVDNLGFRIYREDSKGRELVNRKLIAGSALKTGSGTVIRSGESYAWWDGAKNKNAAYWLEEIDIKGQSTFYGPVYAKRASGLRPARSIAPLLSDLGNGQAQDDSTRVVEPVAKASPRVSKERRKFQASLASQQAVKISIKREGWYRVTAPELFASGLNQNVDTQTLQLFVDGREIPIIVSANKEGRFDESSSIEFYGVGLDTPSTDERVYWLVAGSNRMGKRIQATEDNENLTRARSFRQTVERKDRSIYFASLLNGERENFFGSVVARDALDQSLVLKNLDPSASQSATLEVLLQGVTHSPHRVLVQLNGRDLGEIIFNAQEQGKGNFRAPSSLLREGENTVRLVAQNEQSDVSLVDRIRISYRRAYTADDDRLTFTVGSRQRAIVGGFASRDIRVFDVTDGDNVRELRGEIEEGKRGYSIAFSNNETGERRILALTNERASRAEFVRSNCASDWRKYMYGADFVIIAPREFFAAIEPLKSRRESEGLKVALVDVEDVYDEFGFGHKSPRAIKGFLKLAWTSWELKPRYVLFAADASFDTKNYLGLGRNDILPTKLIDTAYMETASDDWFVDFDDDGVAEMAVGRLPVRTVGETSNIIGKILGYDDAKASEEILLVSDANDGFDFEQASSQLRSLIPSNFRVEAIYRGQLDAEVAKSRLFEAINRGQKIINYTGHGSVGQWRGSLLTSAEARDLANTNKLPMFVMMNCLNGYFHDAFIDSLGESLIKAERGGGIAIWTSSGLSQPQEQAAMNRQLYQLLFEASGNALTIGETTRRAKMSVLDRDIRRTWILLGDPTMRLR
jgi:photosystem II stability/assembly factor-like uncharacterized protein